MGGGNPYRVLGIAPDATGGDIRRAYQTLALRYHPDTGGDESGERFVEIHEAYELLSNPGTRADYDRTQRTYAERLHEREFAPPMAVSSLFEVADAVLAAPFEMLALDLLGFVH